MAEVGTRAPLLGYLYAQPLFTYVKGARSRIFPLPLLDIDAELLVLQEKFRDAESVFRFQARPATPSSLTSLLTLGCTVLHYSGHGACDSLCLEKPGSSGEPHFLTTSALNSYFSSGGNVVGPKLVFVSACSSENAGRAFVAAGIAHVVAMQQGDRLSDEDAQLFAGEFYLSLLTGHSVQQAFDAGKKCVDLTRAAAQPSNHATARDPNEPERFLLLPQDGDHSEVIFPPGALAHGEFIDETPPAPPNYTDRGPPLLVGRRWEMHLLLERLRTSNCCVVEGKVGTGKTTLAICAADYAARRSAFSEVHFFSLREARRDSGFGLGLSRSGSIDESDGAAALCELIVRFIATKRDLDLPSTCKCGVDDLLRLLGAQEAPYGSAEGDGSSRKQPPSSGILQPTTFSRSTSSGAASQKPVLLILDGMDMYFNASGQAKGSLDELLRHLMNKRSKLKLLITASAPGGAPRSPLGGNEWWAFSDEDLDAVVPLRLNLEYQTHAPITLRGLNRYQLAEMLHHLSQGRLHRDVFRAPPYKRTWTPKSFESLIYALSRHPSVTFCLGNPRRLKNLAQRHISPHGGLPLPPPEAWQALKQSLRRRRNSGLVPPTGASPNGSSEGSLRKTSCNRQRLPQTDPDLTAAAKYGGTQGRGQSQGLCHTLAQEARLSATRRITAALSETLGENAELSFDLKGCAAVWAAAVVDGTSVTHESMMKDIGQIVSMVPWPTLQSRLRRQFDAYAHLDQGDLPTVPSGAESALAPLALGPGFNYFAESTGAPTSTTQIGRPLSQLESNGLKRVLVSPQGAKSTGLAGVREVVTLETFATFSLDWVKLLRAVRLLRREWHCASPVLLRAFLPRPDAETMLKACKPGTFMMRFSETRPGYLAISLLTEKRALPRGSPASIRETPMQARSERSSPASTASKTPRVLPPAPRPRRMISTPSSVHTQSPSDGTPEPRSRPPVSPGMKGTTEPAMASTPQPERVREVSHCLVDVRHGVLEMEFLNGKKSYRELEDLIVDCGGLLYTYPGVSVRQAFQQLE